MQTITISDEAHKRLMDQRIGGEALSTTILRIIPPVEKWDVHKLQADMAESMQSEKRYSHEEVFRGV